MKRQTRHPFKGLGHRIDQTLIRTLGPAQIGPYGPSGHPQPTGDEICEHCGYPERAHMIIRDPDPSVPPYSECPGPRDSSG
jgi:hypothetical protein